MLIGILGCTAFVAIGLKKFKVVHNKASFFKTETTKGKNSSCNDLIGTWKNQLNSNLTISSVSGNSFTGGYHTAVESTPGAARYTSKVSGMIVPTESGKLIGFNVLWNKGESLTAWVGQYLECDGKEYIFTTWILRSYQPAEKRWMTTRINQDTFWKISNEPSLPEAQGSKKAESQKEVNDREMQGTWTSTKGDSLDVNELLDSGSWKGKHNVEKGKSSEAVGRFDGKQTFTAMGLIAASDNKIRGWTGHVDEPRASTSKMETSWLEHTFCNSCQNPRRYVRFGMNDYFKY